MKFHVRFFCLCFLLCGIVSDKVVSGMSSTRSLFAIQEDIKILEGNLRSLREEARIADMFARSRRTAWVKLEIEKNRVSLPGVRIHNDELNRYIARFEPFSGGEYIDLPHNDITISIADEYGDEFNYNISHKDIPGLKSITLRFVGKISLCYHDPALNKEINVNFQDLKFNRVRVYRAR